MSQPRACAASKIASVLSFAGLMASMGSMTTTRRTRRGMLGPLDGSRIGGRRESSVCDGRIRPLGKTVNHANDVYTLLPPNVDPEPRLASPGYVKKPQDSSADECAASTPRRQFNEEHD